MSPREVRLERLHPRELHAAMAEAPVAWVPWGATDFHAAARRSRSRPAEAGFDRAALRLHNPTLGETSAVLSGGELSPEVGFCVRRLQTAEIRLPLAVEPGTHEVTLEAGLAGVLTGRLDRSVDFT